VPIIGVTGNTVAHCPDVYRSVGMVACVCKPVDFGRLASTIGRHLRVV